MSSSARQPAQRDARPFGPGRLRQFESIRDTILQRDRFVLLPVESEAARGDAGLANWLSLEGLTLQRISPHSPDDWMAATDLLLGDLTPGMQAILLCGDVGPACDETLDRLERRHGSVAKKEMALIWGGPRSFLCRTWERAPSLWKLARRTQPGTLTPDVPLYSGPNPEDPPRELLLEHLLALVATARRHGDVPEVVDLTLLTFREYLGLRQALECQKLMDDQCAWLDERAQIYPEIRNVVAAHRPRLERAMGAVLAHETRLGGTDGTSADPREALTGRALDGAPRSGTEPLHRASGEQSPPSSFIPERRRTIPPPPSCSPIRRSCRSCEGTGLCLTCAGSGTWYTGEVDEEPCSNCKGTGRCPDC